MDTSFDDAGRLPPPNSAVAAHGHHSETVDEFCLSERISRALFYKMQAEGWGPDVMAIGAVTRISPEAKQRFRQQREQARRMGVQRALPNNIT